MARYPTVVAGGWDPSNLRGDAPKPEVAVVTPA